MATLTKSDIHTYMEYVTGKSMIITGGTTGIGRAAAELFVSYGAKVLIYGRHKTELNNALKDIKQVCDAGGEIYGIIADQAKKSDITKVFKKADEVFGKKLDILINNAGLEAEAIKDMKTDDWRYVVESNLLGYMACSQEAVKRMEKKGSGHIIFIGSMSADEREGGSSVYVATKTGIQGFAEALRKEVNKMGIKVSLIEPGSVGTDMQDETPQQQRKKQKKGEMLKAQDIAVCIHYCLTQPARCDVVEVKIRPHLQAI